MKRQRILPIFALILAIVLLLGIGFAVGRNRVPSAAVPALYSLPEFEKTVLKGKEYTRLALSEPIFYAPYDPSCPCIYLYLLEAQGNGLYTIAIEAGGIGFTMDNGKPVAAEFMFQPLQMNMVFSPTSIAPHEGYQETAFSDAYLYTSEDYTIVLPISGSK